MGLSRLLKTVNNLKKESSFEEGFIEDYNNAILKNIEIRPVPMDRYRPSTLADGCKRMIYYQRLGVGAIEKQNSTLSEICDNGTDRHCRIQNTIQSIEGLEWLDVEEVVKEARSRGINTTFLGWDDSRVEAKCHNSDLKINFLCDGIIKYKNKEIILEIKTIHQFGFSKLDRPLEKHIRQVACYSMSLGIDYVLFFYEDRNFLKKKAFLYKVTEEDKRNVLKKIEDVEKALEEGVPPVKELDKCLYCDRKGYCKNDEE